jgi:alcohol dehydrogenase (NADP+)
VSNFALEELLDVISWSEIPPAVVQRRSDLFVQDRAMLRVCQAFGIQYAAYSPLGTQHVHRSGKGSPVLSQPAVLQIAGKYGASAAQVRLVV